MLENPPDSANEVCLLNERALPLRMLLAGGPEACQVTDLLHALLRNKGAAALGQSEMQTLRRCCTSSQA